MNQEEFTQNLSLWLDDELESAQIAPLQQQMADHAGYHDLYQQMKQLDTALHEAALQVTTPDAGFAERFETRLAQHNVKQQRQAWLAMTALLLGTAFLLILFTYEVVALLGLTGIPLSLDISTLQQGQIVLIDWVSNLYSLVNLGGVVLKAGLIIIQQPLFWVCAFMSVMVMGMWAGVMQRLYRQQSLSLPMLA